MLKYLMHSLLEDNQSRKQIIILLKKNGQMTVSGISELVGVTPMAVRQHLMSLEKKGMVSYIPKKYGVGRPVYLYSLTDRALELFPRAYGQFIKDLLLMIEIDEGRDKVEHLFKLRSDNILLEKQRSLEGFVSMEDKVIELNRQLNEDGFMTDLEMDDSSFIIKKYNCLVSSVAEKYRELCKHELQLYRDLLHNDTIRSKCQIEGDNACTYIIPRDN